MKTTKCLESKPRHQFGRIGPAQKIRRSPARRASDAEGHPPPLRVIPAGRGSTEGACLHHVLWAMTMPRRHFGNDPPDRYLIRMPGQTGGTGPCFGWCRSKAGWQTSLSGGGHRVNSASLSKPALCSCRRGLLGPTAFTRASAKIITLEAIRPVVGQSSPGPLFGPMDTVSGKKSPSSATLGRGGRSGRHASKPACKTDGRRWSCVKGVLQMGQVLLPGD